MTNQRSRLSTGTFGLALSLSALSAGVIGCPAENAPADEVDSAMFDRGSAGTVDVMLALGVSDAMFAFDPTLDPSMSAEANASAIASHVGEIQGGCASASVSGSSVTVTFASGCVLRTGLSASGSVTVEVARAASALDVMVSFDALVVGSRTLDGTAAFHTENGSVLGIELALTGATGSVSTDLTVTGTSGAMEFDGTATVTRDGTSTALSFTDVLWRLRECYPSAGSVTVTTGRVSQTVTFTSATPSTGTVTITQGRTSRDATLPAYGSCPMGV
jgi:hypothetical protein